MKQENSLPVMDFPAVAFSLSVAGGFLDAYTYLCRDHVFANAQTGNIVQLGLTLAQGQFDTMMIHLIPILAFSAGILLSMVLRRSRFVSSPLRWQQTVLLLEALITGVVAWIPIGPWNVAATVLVSFLCALQVETFRKIAGNAFASTMCTGNLRSGTELFYRFVKDKDKAALKNSMHYFLVILFFVLGALLGVWITVAFLEKAVLVCVPLLLFSLLFLTWKGAKIEEEC